MRVVSFALRQRGGVFIFLLLMAFLPLSGCSSGGSTTVAPPIAGLVDAPATPGDTSNNSGNNNGNNNGNNGGGGDSDTPSLTLAQLRLAVDWPQRAVRAARVSALANSLTVTVTGGRRDGADYVWKIKRNPDPNAYSTVYVSPEAVRVGATRVRITIFAGADGDGQVLGVADVAASIDSEGNGIPDVAIASPVKTVAIEHQSPLGVLVEGTITPVVVARDKDNHIVPISADDVTLTKAPVAGGSAAYVDIDATTVIGKAINAATGTGPVNLTATVDGITSDPVLCTVYFAGQIYFPAPVPTIIGRGAVATFQARVSGTTDQGILWSVTSEGDSGDAGTITPDGVYTAPNRTTTVIIHATSQYDNTKFTETRVTIKPVGINAIIN